MERVQQRVFYAKKITLLKDCLCENWGGTNCIKRLQLFVYEFVLQFI